MASVYNGWNISAVDEPYRIQEHHFLHLILSPVSQRLSEVDRARAVPCGTLPLVK
jgi:hypothetical protein